jgi:hypothetical protein
MEILKLISGLAMIACVVVLGFQMIDPKSDPVYKQGVLDTYKEAYENGHMEKEITKDDKVIYRWKHLEKIGYEGSN